MVVFAKNLKSQDNNQNQPQPSQIPLVPVHYLHELPQADEERLEKLFNHLDRDGNGRIDIHDLSAALKEIGISSKYAEVMIVN